MTRQEKEFQDEMATFGGIINSRKFVLRVVTWVSVASLACIAGGVASGEYGALPKFDEFVAAHPEAYYGTLGAVLAAAGVTGFLAKRSMNYWGGAKSHAMGLDVAGF